MANYMLHFTASDAILVREYDRLGLPYWVHGEGCPPDSLTLGPFPDYVELTYEYLRVGPDGDHIAVLDNKRGGWVVGVNEQRKGIVNVMDGTGAENAPVFSDVTIMTVDAADE